MAIQCMIHTHIICSKISLLLFVSQLSIMIPTQMASSSIAYIWYTPNCNLIMELCISRSSCLCSSHNPLGPSLDYRKQSDSCTSILHCPTISLAPIIVNYYVYAYCNTHYNYM